MDQMLPQIEIRFESLYSTEDELNRSLEKLGINQNEASGNIIMKTRQCLKKKFIEAFTELNPILENFVNDKMVIVVHQHQNPDHISSAAYFNMLTSNPGSHEFSFGIYLPQIIGYICEEADAKKYPGISDEGIWQHELIHMADYANLFRFLENFKKRDKQNTSQQVWQQYYTPGLKDETSIPWKLLNVLSNFRNEGIANLYDILAGHLNPDFNSIDHAISGFKLVLSSLEAILADQTASQFKIHTYNNTIDEMHSMSYQIGPWFVSNALRNSNDITINNLADKLIQNHLSPTSLTKEEILKLINYSLKQDIGAYLYLNSKFWLGNATKTFFEIDHLIDFCTLFTSDFTTEDHVKNFLKNIMRYAHAKNKDAFLNAINQIIGYPMEDEEIIAEFEQFSKSVDPNNSIEAEVKDRTKSLYDYWLKTKNQIAGYVLSYIFDPEDLLDDSIKYLGYIDDLYVLHACDFLLGIKY